ncbi:DUF5916 domain-containing protein [Flavisolibacter nicotianae]|uniref:DUF5916 domain-containing protein n=1 Tax=Flavisolibacter nicotianae TaxID=2364882 RepID=UPI000EAD1C06|nr:DUF5916 domain-containing protein [Flavisolibacter nicotianae]
MLRGLILAVVMFLTHRGLTQKTLTAYKTLQPPVIDGKLDDAAWQSALPATDFIQNSPNFGQSSLVQSSVKVLYDNNAVYIGAILYDNPGQIQKQLTARDNEQRQNADCFAVFFDTYNDKQNGFQFLVTPANVQTDSKLAATATTGYGDYGDRSWDAVWQSQTSITENGWIAEIRIPYSSLRFARKDIQTWGLQFLRYTRRNNEISYWNPVNPAENGFVNQFGQLTDLHDIQPPLRLSLSPYLSSGVRYYPQNFGKKKDVLHSGGLDVKYGINESFTLDATVIPDFGQVVSDNLVNNLSPFEQQFQENRPFFTEGTELFLKSGLFYSRRIGAIPGGYYAAQELPGYSAVKNPSVTQLYNAVKLSGRTRGKLGIGVFNAVTAPMYATVQNTNTKQDSTFETEPLTNYNLLVLDQALKGRSSITFTNTNVLRSGSARDANVSGLDLSLFTPDNRYQVKLTGRYSKIFGYSALPSFDYSSYGINLIGDTTRINNQLLVKPYDGFKTSLFVGKVSGKLRFAFTTNVVSSKYDPNDMGYLQAPNKVGYIAEGSYNQLTATNRFISYQYTFGTRYSNMFKPYAYDQYEAYARGFWVFKNFWDVALNIGSQPFASHDYFELRTPNRYLVKPAFHYVSAEGSSDSRKKLFVNYILGFSHAEVENGNYYLVNLGTRYRFSNRFTLGLSIYREDEQNQIGYAFVRESNGEPIIGYRRNLQTTAVLNGIYNFTSRLNLTLRTRHYWNQVRYHSFFNVNQDGHPVPRAFLPNQDENYNLFNVDAFFTWDFRPGSRVIAGYKNWLGDPTGVVSQSRYLGNLKNIFQTSHGNELTVKLIYFLDYNQFRKKR